MTINESIFKAYDIRGFYPQDLNEEIAYKIGRAVAQVVEAKTAFVSKDVRLGSDKVYPKFLEGLKDEGVKVDFGGDCTTDTVYFAVGKYGYDLGVSITGSHNPKEYTGFKFVKKGVIPLSGDWGIPQVKDLVIKDKFGEVKKGSINKVDYTDDYINYVLSFVDISKIKPLKVALDTGNGVAGPILTKLFSKLPITIVPLFTNPDGNFPNHLPDPIKEENVSALKKAVVEKKCDFGIAVDGDGDRIFFIDETGRYHLGYITFALLAKSILQKYPKSKILFDPRLTWAVVDTIEQNSGTALLERVGHSLIKARMRREDAVFAGESSGHYFYKENYFADNGAITILYVIDLFIKSGLKFSEMYDHYYRNYFWAGEFNTVVKDTDLVTKKIEEDYSNFEKNDLDGITVSNKRIWRFNVRKSNTEPLIRLNVEAESKEMVDKMVKEVQDKINKYGAL